MAPSALLMLPAGMVLLQGPAPPVVTSKAKSQLAPAGRVTPSSWALVAPGLATMLVAPLQEVDALAGLATLSPAERPLSSTATLVSSPDELLTRLIVTRERPPGVTAGGRKALLAEMPALMVRASETGDGMLPALELKSAGSMVLT